MPANASYTRGRAQSALRVAFAAALRAKPRTYVALAIVIVSAITAYNIAHTNRELGGTRYFWLDDDQMISMRYARNFAEGTGLVWNPGERVEGYTNFGFTMVMALVHALGASDAAAPLIMKLVNLAVAGAVVALTSRVMTALGTGRSLARPAALVALALCVDLVFWSANGFETTAVTAAFLAAVVAVLERSHARPDAEPVGIYGALALACIPVLRGDGLHVWAGAALIALALSRMRARTALTLALSLVPAVLHLAFRRAYYGDWLPNTYYLKSVGLDHALGRGLAYAMRFATVYAVPLLFAFAAMLLPRARRARVLLLPLVPTTVYVLRVGGDNFVHARFFAHVVPIVLVVAVATVDALRRAPLATRALAHAAIFVAAVSVTGVRGPNTLAATISKNGRPAEQMELGVYLRERAYRESSVAVFMAGLVPYVSRLRAYDLLGKADRHVARLPHQPNEPIGHGKVDAEHTLGHHPDFVIFGGPSSVVTAARVAPGRAESDSVRRVLSSNVFQTDYRGTSVDVPSGASSCFVYRGSREIEHLGAHPTP